MDINIERITFSLNNLSIHANIVKIQSYYRGYISRRKMLPLILLKVKQYLEEEKFQFSKTSRDGRINSCVDEDNIVELLSNRFDGKIKRPSLRMWYDVLIFDNMYGWLPVNIKTTTMKSGDNVGNLALCVYSYTDEKLDFDKFYDNKKMSCLLLKKMKDKKLNRIDKKDYYFIVINKNNNQDIIVNSLKGLSHLTPNTNNLPFQIIWDKNRVFSYGNINDKVKLFVKCLQKPKPNWKETFMSSIREINV